MKGVWRILMALLVVSCGNDRTADEEDGFVSGPYGVWMETENDSMNIVRLAVDGEVVDSMTLPFPVYRIDGGDLDADGIPEVCIGVVKATKYWKDVDRRLFIYRLYHGRYIRPLWLGSRVGHRLVDFRVCRDSVPAIIVTDELTRDGVLINGQYELKGFGLYTEQSSE